MIGLRACLTSIFTASLNACEGLEERQPGMETKIMIKDFQVSNSTVVNKCNSPTLE